MARVDTTIGWPAVAEACDTAKSISWDGCHKIYLAMDDQQEAWFLENYEHTLKGTPAALLAQVKKWYWVSCGLRFVEAVSTVTGNPNAGFDNLVPQSYDPDTEEWA